METYTLLWIYYWESGQIQMRSYQLNQRWASGEWIQLALNSRFEKSQKTYVHAASPIRTTNWRIGTFGLVEIRQINIAFLYWIWWKFWDSRVKGHTDYSQDIQFLHLSGNKLIIKIEIQMVVVHLDFYSYVTLSRIDLI